MLDDAGHHLSLLGVMELEHKSQLEETCQGLEEALSVKDLLIVGPQLKVILTEITNNEILIQVLNYFISIIEIENTCSAFQ